MRYLAFATDYDGTLAHHGKVAVTVVEALQRLCASGRKLVLVTGRELPQLEQVFPQLAIFHRVVAENGALLYHPETCQARLLSTPPDPRLITLLEQRGVPVSPGRAIVATWEPHQQIVLESIRELGLDLQVIFNKGAVMVLPSGVNKATGLRAALLELGVSPQNVVGIGDAENDHAFLEACGCAVATANAVESLKQRAVIVTRHPNGSGVQELIDQLLADDLAGYGSPLAGRDYGAPAQEL